MNQQKTVTPSFIPVFSRLRFILVNTSSAGNIGSAARAMKTMGFTDLVLVAPRFPALVQGEEAVALASGAQDVLQQARVVETIEEALQGCNLAAAVSARLREFSPPLVSPREIGEHIAADSDLQAALIFGNERVGLPNDVVQQCNMLINIPANPDYSSLNLSQAVQVLAYECRMAGLATSPEHAAAVQDSAIGFQGNTASVTEIEGMFSHLEQAFVDIGFLNPDSPKRLMPRLKRLFARTQLETEEVNILRGLARQLMEQKQEK